MAEAQASRHTPSPTSGTSAPQQQAGRSQLIGLG
jgi:hypothetical protein